MTEKLKINEAIDFKLEKILETWFLIKRDGAVDLDSLLELDTKTKQLLRQMQTLQRKK